MRILLKLTLSIFLFVQISIFAQSILDRAQYPKKPIADIRTVEKNPSLKFSKSSDVYEVPGYTDYDYIGNVGVPELFSPYDIDGDGDFDPVGVFNERYSETGNGIRRVAMFIGLGGEFANFYLFDTTLHSGWPTIQSITKGPWSGHAAVMFQQGSKTYLSLIEMSTLSPTTEELDFYSLSSSFCYLDDGTIFGIDSEGKLRKLMTDNLNQSTDTGIQFHQSTAFQPIKSSFNDEYLGVLGFTEEDEVILYFSNDRGETWNEEVIGQNLVTEVDNREGVFPLFTNFAQASYVLDNNGTVHIGMNGYGIKVDGSDTSFTYPAIYWNSKHRDWIAVSDPSEEGEELGKYYPGNGIGNAYPTPMVTKNGHTVSIFFQSPEYKNEQVQIYSGDGSDSNYECYFTDISIADSPDSGKSFFLPHTFAGDPRVSDVFPSTFDLLIHSTPQPPIFSWDAYGWYFIYMRDEIPGCSIFEENSISENSNWQFKHIGSATTDMEEKTSLANAYLLSQNYPNPFNPTTTIKFTVPDVGTSRDLSLRVYDVLGREVNTLVNEQKPPGNYSVIFDASDLSSGIYFYVLESSNARLSKKMLLLK